MRHEKTLLEKRFEDLDAQFELILATKQYQGDGYVSGDYVDNEMLISWRVKVENLLGMVCDSNSPHLVKFRAMESGAYLTNCQNAVRQKAVFDATREDFLGGYLNSVRNLVQAEVFGNELEQAQELLANGYKTAAAVVAGVVLETTLRQMCSDAGLPVGNLNKMNADLAKAAKYHMLVQKRITALADIRNNAAHGNAEKFTDADVADMIKHVEMFVADTL